MSNPNREYDKTHLSIDTAEERVLIHRDYIAHCLRWSHIVKFLMQKHRYKTARLLDVGCGREVPLGKLLYSNRMSGAKYMGVDMNEIFMPEMLVKAESNGKMEVRLRGHCDASILRAEDMPWAPNTIVCLEVFEHVTPKIARRLVVNLYNLMAEGGDLFISTPCWNGDGADNHINETSYDVMGSLLEDIGWGIVGKYGTFASQREYVPMLSPAEKSIFDKLSEYYDSNLLAIMLAPLHPNGSRNVLWHCTKLEWERTFPPLIEQPEPWSEHPNYKELNG